MSRPSLSIAMCTYNGARYVQEQLESIVAQTRQPDELVVCDDRSTDQTVEIVQAFASRASFPVRVYANDENLGSTKNFERAISLCTSDIIALADQDDLWHPQKLERIEQTLLQSPKAGAVFTDAEVVDASLRPTGHCLWKIGGFTRDEQLRVLRGEAYQVLLRHNVVTGATMAFRAEFKPLILPIPETWVHDSWIALIISAVADLTIIDEPLVSYRQHPSNQIGAFKIKTKKPRRPFLEIYKDRIDRFIAARERLLAMRHKVPIPRWIFLELDGKIGHLQARGALPNSRWRRLPIGLRELASLRYHRYHNGVVSFANDLFRAVPKVQIKQ